MDNQLTNLITSLYEARQAKGDAAKLEEAILEALKPLVDPKFDDLPDEPLTAGGLQLKRSSGENRTIKADLLLERGVSPDVVRYATKVTLFHRYTVSKPKEGG